MVKELEVSELEEQAAAACKEWCRSREAVSVARTGLQFAEQTKSRQELDELIQTFTFEALGKEISRVFKNLV